MKKIQTLRFSAGDMETVKWDQLFSSSLHESEREQNFKQIKKRPNKTQQSHFLPFEPFNCDGFKYGECFLDISHLKFLKQNCAFAFDFKMLKCSDDSGNNYCYRYWWPLLLV